MHALTIVLPPDPVLFDFAAAYTIFALGARRQYKVEACRSGSGPVLAHGALSIQVERDLGALEAAETVIVPGLMDADAPLPTALLDGLRRAHAGGCRVVSICSGAFVLAEAGLLDGRRATTHWEAADQLAARYPKVLVDPDVLYVDEGDVLTSAGVTAGLDLCLHILRKDFGEQLANSVARRMVFGPHRAGGQAQYIDRPLGPARSCSLDATRQWLLERLDQPISVPQMADHACLSVRAFARRFHEETGVSPHQWLIAQRIAMARRLLEGSDISVEQVAGRCGFGSTLSFRQHFKRHVRTSPAAYRQTFRRGVAKPALESVA